MKGEVAPLLAAVLSACVSSPTFGVHVTTVACLLRLQLNDKR